NAELDFLLYMRDMGRAAAEDFLESSFDKIGVEPTLNLEEEIKVQLHAIAPEERPMGRRMSDAFKRFGRRQG
ncbi:MAG: hypothetical protein AAFR39_15115, partial [Pseudomonadota bacterium]